MRQITNLVIKIADVISNGFSNKKSFSFFLIKASQMLKYYFFLPPDFSLVKDQIMDIRLE